MDIFPCKQFQVYIANLKAKQPSLSKFMLGTFVSSAFEYIIFSVDDEVYRWKIKGYVSMQWDNGSTNPTVNVVRSAPPEPRNERVDICILVNQLDENSHNE